MITIELKIQGMQCSACVKRVTEALSPLAGVIAVEVDLQAGQVRASGSPDTEELLAALDAAGYPAQVAALVSPIATKRGGCCCSKTTEGDDDATTV